MWVNPTLLSNQLKASRAKTEVSRRNSAWKQQHRKPQFSSVQSLSCAQLFATPWIAAHQASLSITNSQSPPKPTSIELVMPSNHLILCCPFLLLPSIFPSISAFSNESDLHIRWPNYWSFSFNISPPNERPGLVFFRMDWLDLLAVQRTHKILLQHHSSKASIIWHSAFFIVQLSHSYMTIGKTIALTGWTFVGKECLCFLIQKAYFLLTSCPADYRLASSHNCMNHFTKISLSGISLLLLLIC